MRGVAEAIEAWHASASTPRLAIVRPRRWDDAASATHQLRPALSGAEPVEFGDLVGTEWSHDRAALAVAAWWCDTADLVARACDLGLDSSDVEVLDADPMTADEAASRAADWVSADEIADAQRRSAGRRRMFDALLARADDWDTIAGEVHEALGDPPIRAVAAARAIAPGCPWSVIAATSPVPAGADLLEQCWGAIVAAGLTDAEWLVPAVAEVVEADLGDVNRQILAEQLEDGIVARGIADVGAADSLAALGPATERGLELLTRCVGRLDDRSRWASAAFTAGDRSAAVVSAMAADHLRDGRLDQLLGFAGGLMDDPATRALGAWFGAVAAARLGRWEQAAAAMASAADLGHPGAASWSWLVDLACGRRREPVSADRGVVDAALAQFGDVVAHTIAGGDLAAGLGAAAATMNDAAAVGWPFDPVAAACVTADVLGVTIDGSAAAPVGPERRSVDALRALRSGRWADAREVADELDVGGRVGLVLAAVRVGVARRSGDLVALTAAWERERAVIVTAEADMFVVDAVGELLAAAARLGRWADVRPLAESLEAVVRETDVRSPWRARSEWHRFLAAVAAIDRGLAGESAARLRAIVGGTHREVLAAAAANWCSIIAGESAAGADTAAEALATAGWPWEASRLAGAAAAVTPDVAASRRLLELARTLRPGGARGSGDSPLTAREQEIGALVAAGATYKEIGGQLYISPKTVEHHVARIRTKLGATTRAEMLAALREFD